MDTGEDQKNDGRNIMSSAHASNGTARHADTSAARNKGYVLLSGCVHALFGGH